MNELCSDWVLLLTSAKSTHSYVYKVELDYIGHSTEAAEMPYGANAKMLRLPQTFFSLTVVRYQHCTA